MTAFFAPIPPVDEARARNDVIECRARLAKLIAVCVAVLAALVFESTPSDTAIAGASSQSFAQWYDEDEANRFHYWYSSDPRNASYFHIREHFGHGSHGDRAMRVAQCESELWPDALNRYSGASGVFQVMPFWRDRYAEVTGRPYYDDRFNPDANAAFAAWLQREEGWGQWVCKG